MTVLELVQNDPNLDMELQMVNKKLNRGELLSEIIGLTSDNEKIVTDLAPEDQLGAEGGVDEMGNPIGPETLEPGNPLESQEPASEEDEDIQAQVNIQAVMEEHGVDEETAAIMLEAENLGHDPQDIIDYIRGGQNG